MLIYLLLPILSFAAPSPGDRLEKACAKRLKAEKTVKDACHCLRVNLEKKAKPAEVTLLAESYEGSKVAEKKLQKPENEALSFFDLEIIENCLADKNWKIEEEKPSVQKTKK